MNYWTQLSRDFANQHNYLDLLFRVYPIIPEDCRDIDNFKWNHIVKAFNEKDNFDLIKMLLKFDLFPIKDSYVAYLKRDPSAALRNPDTVARLSGRLYEIGLSKIYERCSEPKETNRQIGPLFRKWYESGCLGIKPTSLEGFIANTDNAILGVSENEMLDFARNYLGYELEKRPDFIARFNGKYILGEAKFLTDYGGHQNAQFEDAIRVINSNANAIKIAILDGVLYIPSKSKMYRYLEVNEDKYIMSALTLREFLFQV